MGASVVDAGGKVVCSGNVKAGCHGMNNPGGGVNWGPTTGGMVPADVRTTGGIVGIQAAFVIASEPCGMVLFTVAEGFHAELTVSMMVAVDRLADVLALSLIHI